jgi:cytochrome P450
MIVLLLFAGHETTTNLIGNGMAHLMGQRDQWSRLCGDPAVIGTAVEELLRFDAPVQSTYRIAKVHTTLSGLDVKPGAIVLMLIGAANRDPNAFESPDRLDLGRTPNRYLSFIVGQRFCLGASLARLGRIAFAGLARRWPDICLIGDELEWDPGYILRGLKRLPVRPRSESLGA